MPTRPLHNAHADLVGSSEHENESIDQDTVAKKVILNVILHCLNFSMHSENLLGAMPLVCPDGIPHTNGNRRQS